MVGSNRSDARKRKHVFTFFIYGVKALKEGIRIRMGCNNLSNDHTAVSGFYHVNQFAFEIRNRIRKERRLHKFRFLRLKSGLGYLIPAIAMTFSGMESFR
jgi:hypothetical protein